MKPRTFYDKIWSDHLVDEKATVEIVDHLMDLDDAFILRTL